MSGVASSRGGQDGVGVGVGVDVEVARRDWGIGVVRRNEPLGKPSSLVPVVAVASVGEQVRFRSFAARRGGGRGRSVPSAESTSISFSFAVSGLGCWAVSRSFWWRRSRRASSTGWKTRARSLVRFAFLEEERRPFAIFAGGAVFV